MTASPEQKRLDTRLERIDNQLSDLARFTLESAQREERARTEFRKDIAEFKDGMSEFRASLEAANVRLDRIEANTERQSKNLDRIAATVERQAENIARMDATNARQTENIDRLVRIVEILLPDRQSS
jgi:methyl-accepting chemotaxis protein